MVPVAPIFTGNNFDFTFHRNCVSLVRVLHFKIFGFFLIIFLPLGIAVPTTDKFLLLESWIIMSGLLVGNVFSAITC